MRMKQRVRSYPRSDRKRASIVPFRRLEGDRGAADDPAIRRLRDPRVTGQIEVVPMPPAEHVGRLRVLHADVLHRAGVHDVHDRVDVVLAWLANVDQSTDGSSMRIPQPTRFE
jgi:hypothetical protein